MTGKGEWRTYYEKNKDKAYASQRRWSARNPEKIRLYKRAWRYGIPIADIEAMWLRQEGRCAICKDKLDFAGRGSALDHDHRTGRMRAFLCRDCTIAIGHAPDDPDRMISAAQSLRAPPPR